MNERERPPRGRRSAPRSPREPTTDEFGREDPDSIERQRRRVEREQRRAQGQKAVPRRGQRGGGGGGGPRLPRLPKMPRRPGRTPGSGGLKLPGRGRPGPTLLLIGAAVLFIIFLIALFQPFKGEGSGTVIVNIPEGASAGEVGDILDERGVVTSGTLFEIRATLAGKRGQIQAGTYSLKQGMSYSATLDQLAAPANQRVIVVTIPEGYSRSQIAEVAKQAGLKGNYLKETVAQKGFNPGKYRAKGAKDLEGFLFPATYELERGSSAKDLVRKQLDAFEQNMAQVNLKPAKSKGLTAFDVLIIASMVDREVQVAKERPLVAGVIRNRIRDGMPLGIDATVRFAVDNYTEPLTQSQLNSNSPYNTRKFTGLPPGPIGNPGLASIEAAAQPVKVDYLFYVVKPNTCGEHTFATTEAEFERASKEYERAREQAGGQSPTNCPSG